MSGKPGSMVFVGGLMADHIAAVDTYPAADERVLARAVIRSGGGPASTAAVAAARLGVHDVAFVGTVGQDAAGDYLLAELAAEGIDTSGVTRLPDRATGASVIIADVSAGSRAICTQPGPPVQLNSTAEQLIRSARWVHIDHLGWPVVAPVIDGGSSQVSVDISYPVAGFSPQGVDLYVPNAPALAARYSADVDDVDLLLDRALAEGPGTVVITRGSQGSVGATQSGVRGAAAPHRSPITSTLGAGDVFHGALLAALDQDQGLVEAMRYAGVVAALSCRALDGRSAIPDHHETLVALRTSTA